MRASLSLARRTVNSSIKQTNKQSINQFHTSRLSAFSGDVKLAPKPKNRRILVTGSVGQIGVELVSLLRKKYGAENVFASDIKAPEPLPTTTDSNNQTIHQDGPFVQLDVLNQDLLSRIVLENGIDTIVHLASMLSALGEKYPAMAQKLNVRGIEHVLELAAKQNLTVFAPSTIAVFGPSTPAHNTPDLTVMRPTTIYGVTKVYLELLGQLNQTINQSINQQLININQHQFSLT